MAALEKLTVTSEKLFNISCGWECPRPVFVTDSSVATHLYRIAQEAISNAVKHGRAKTITIALVQSGPDVTLTITDDGCGMGGNWPAVKGMGLRIMDYRAEMVGAVIQIGPAPNQGTFVSCTFKADYTAGTADMAGTAEEFTRRHGGTRRPRREEDFRT
jgi:signal transduction histidine kinase